MPNITQKQISDNYLAYLQGQNSNINASAPFSYWSIIAGAEGSVFLDLYANLDIVGKSIYIQNLQGSQIDNKLYESGLTPRGALTVSVIGVSFELPVTIPANTQFQTTNGIIYTLYQGVDYTPPTSASFTTSATSGNVPLSVTFTNTTTGIPNVGFTWAWNVTGGIQGTDWNFTTGSSSSQDVVIQFITGSVGGKPYSVTLNASLGGVTYAPQTVIITANPAPTNPTVVLSNPSPTTNVSINPTITLTFSEAVTGVNTTSIQLSSSIGTIIPITIPAPVGNAYTLSLTTSLLNATQYIVGVLTGITSVATGLSVTPINFNFTTAPAAAVQADFSFLPTNPITTDTVVFTDTTPTPQPTGYAWTISPTTGWNYTGGTSAISRNPSIQFTVAGSYDVTNAPTGSVPYTTKTRPVPVTAAPTNPTVVLTSPSPTTNVPTSTSIVLTFSEDVTGVTPTTTPAITGTIQFQIPGQASIPIRITPFAGSYYVYPQVALSISTTYRVIVNSGITSVATGRAVAATQFNFTTASASGNLTDPQKTPVTLYAIIGGSSTFIGANTLLTTTLPIVGVPTTVTATVVTSTAGQNQESDQSCVNRLLLQKRSPNCGARIGDYYIYAREASTAVTDVITVPTYTTIDGINSLGVIPLIGSFITEYQLNLGLPSIVYPPTNIPPSISFSQYNRLIDTATFNIVKPYVLSSQLLGLQVTVIGCTTYSIPLAPKITVTVSLPTIYTLDTVLQIPSLAKDNSVITISINISDLIKREVRRVICNQPYGGTNLDLPTPYVNNYNFITLNDIINGLNYQLSYNNGQIAKLLLDVKISGSNIQVPKQIINQTSNPDGIYEGIYDISTYDTISIGT